MKPESLVILFLTFSIITIAIGGIIGDMQSNYNVNVSKEWEDQYSFSDNINSSVSEVSTKLDEVGESKGYITIVTGVSALWSGLKATITMILATPVYLATSARGVSAGLNLPPVVSSTIVPIFIIMLIVVVIFMGVRLARGDSV
jgi:hypothetical protein